MHQEDPGMEIAAKRAKFWGRARFKVSNSTIHILERWNISWSWNIYILERWNTHILEHLYLGARLFRLWSWSIHILECWNISWRGKYNGVLRTGTLISCSWKIYILVLEYSCPGAGTLIFCSWNTHILEQEHSRLGGEHLQS